MLIPINTDYRFTIKVLQEDSFLPQDLTNISYCKFSVLEKKTSNIKITVDLNNGITVTDASNGLIMIDLTPTQTNVLVEDKSYPEDDYTPKANYRGSIIIRVNDEPDINVFIEDIAAAAVMGV